MTSWLSPAAPASDVARLERKVWNTHTAYTPHADATPPPVTETWWGSERQSHCSGPQLLLMHASQVVFGPLSGDGAIVRVPASGEHPPSHAAPELLPLLEPEPELLPLLEPESELLPLLEPESELPPLLEPVSPDPESVVGLDASTADSVRLPLSSRASQPANASRATAPTAANRPLKPSFVTSFPLR